MDNANRTNGKDISETVGLLPDLLIGGLAGLGAMMLFTPQSGKKTRTQSKHMSKDDNKIKIHVPGEPQEAAKKIENIPNRDSSTLKIKDQEISEELLANDSLGG
jgi:gas vesicle protein